MSQLSVSAGDVNCRYLAAPESSNDYNFGLHLKALGIKLPLSLSIREMVARGWLRPRLRVALPAAALLSWRNFATYEAQYDGSCPAEDAWALNAWAAAVYSRPDLDRPVDKLWMHWLDDPQDDTGVRARKNTIDPVDPAAEPASFTHPHGNQTVLPWIDFFADWQGYHVAELVRNAEFIVHGMTDQFLSLDRHLRDHADGFDEDAKGLAARWEEWGAFFDHVSCYRTILAQVARRDNFDEDARRGARSWTSQRGLDGAAIRAGIRDVLLRLWRRWENAPPLSSPRLRHRLQQDIQYATRILSHLTDAPLDPLDPFWCSQTRSRGQCADLIDALPYEEWTARREFPLRAVHYQQGFPHPFLMGRDQLAVVLTKHWLTCAPLRRLCLAWVRLHEEMGKRDQDLPADMTIKANERIEQFNLIALHTERLLRHVATTLTPATSAKQEGSPKVIREAAQRSLTHVANPVAVPDQRIDDLIRQHTALHTMPDLAQRLCFPTMVASGSDPADHLLAAHVNALIARNYAAHHDYFDDELIYPSSDETKPHPGATMLSSCLLVVVAALHSLPVHVPTAKP